MTTRPPPFRFDVRGVLSSARRKLNSRVGGVSISLPFISFRVEPHDLERKVAREIVIRLADRRVLNAFECCDDCIAQALASIQEIRSLLVNKQVDLAQVADGPLFLLLLTMLEPIRQFFTFVQRLSGDAEPSTLAQGSPAAPFTPQESYFAALEMLRAHLHRCLVQVAVIAEMTVPGIADHMRYPDPWQLEAYEPLEEAEGGV